MKIKCLICKDIIESKYTHNLVSCRCENCYIDGGKDYCHFGGKDFNKILLIFDDGIEVLASNQEIYNKKYEKWENENIIKLINGGKK